MKHQIQRLSPHQNAKVFSVLMAVSSLVFFVPFIFIVSLSAPPEAAPSFWFFLLAPLFYLIFGYIMVVIGCWFYNFMFRFVGGIEFTSKTEST